MPARLAPAVALLATLGIAAPAAATTTINVTTQLDNGANTCGSSNTPCSLRSAIAAAQAGDTVSLPAGTYNLTQGQLLIQRGITVAGPDPRSTTIQQATVSSRVIQIKAPSAIVTLSGVTISGGSADDSSPAPASTGGGIELDGGTLDLTDAEIVDNRVSTANTSTAANGGGLALSNLGTAHLTRVTVAGNRATGTLFEVAGIADNGVLTMDDSTVSGNVATGATDGVAAVGGIELGFFSSSGTLAAANVTLAGNRASGASGPNAFNAGNLTVAEGSASLADTIIADGQGDAGRENCVTGGPSATITSRGYNLEDRPDQCSLTGVGDKVGMDPLLGPLVNNGGLTDTMALGPGSPAIDTGNPAGCPNAAGNGILTTDQRGHGRSGRCDIGAYELDHPVDGGGSGGSNPGGGGNGGTPSGGTQPRTTPPVLASLKVAPAAFRAAPSGATIARRRARRTPIGATISYRDSESATATLTILRRLRGVRRGRSCVAPPRRVRRGTVRCTRLVAVGSVSHRDVVGAERMHFTGRVRGRKLAPGGYVLRAVARNGAGQASRTLTAGFRIVR